MHSEQKETSETEVSFILSYSSSLFRENEGHEHSYAYHKDDSPEDQGVIVARCGGLTVADVDEFKAFVKLYRLTAEGDGNRSRDDAVRLRFFV